MGFESRFQPAERPARYRQHGAERHSERGCRRELARVVAKDVNSCYEKGELGRGVAVTQGGGLGGLALGCPVGAQERRLESAGGLLAR